MKKIYSILLFFIVGVCITACSKQTSTPLETTSPDQQVKITVTANRTNSLDPWMVDIAMTKDGKTTNASREFYAKEVTDKNVTFEWQSDRDCIISMTQQDGEIITIPVQLSE